TQVIVGTHVTLFVGDDTGGRRIGSELTAGTAIFLRGADGSEQYELGTVTGCVRVLGTAGFTFDATATLRRHETGDALEGTAFVLNGETVTLAFTEDEVASAGVPFVQVVATGVDINLSGFATLHGNFTFTRTADAFVAAGTDITAFAGSGFGTASESGIKISS